MIKGGIILFSVFFIIILISCISGNANFVNYGKIKVDKYVYDNLENKNSNLRVMILINGTLHNKNSEIKKINVLSSLSKSDFKLIRNINGSNWIAGELTKSGLEKLKSNNDIIKINKEVMITIALDKSVPLINAPSVWNEGYLGSDQTICVLDTGVNASHPDLIGKIIDERCYCSSPEGNNTYCCPNNESVDNNAEDNNGHGTHVTGIIVSQNSVYKGVAPGAKIVMVKIANSSGNNMDSDLVSGIQYCADHKNDYNISIISISFGSSLPYLFDNINDCDNYGNANISIVYARSKGIFIDASSGNNFSLNSISYPACVEGVVSVGETTKQDEIANESNRGDLLDLLAPGSNINSLDYNNGGISTMSGTSMSAPHVAGAVALLLQRNSTLTPDQILITLKNTGIKIDKWRRIDILSAFNSLGINLFPTNPHSLLCNGIPCINNDTFYNNIIINCSGSEDRENDSLTYYIDAFYNHTGFFNINYFNNSIEIENLSYNGKQNITRYLEVHKYANVISAYINLSGYKISNKTNPKQISSFSNSSSINNPNNFKKFGNYVYISSNGGNGSLTILDISNKTNIKQIGYFSNYSSMNAARSIEIENDYAYIAASINQITIINITNKSNPFQISSYINNSIYQPLYLSVKNDYMYIVTSNSSLIIFNITNKTNPIQIGYFYNSLMNQPSDLFLDGNYIYISSHYNTVFTIIDVTNKSNPFQVGSINETIYATSIYIKNDYAYISASYPVGNLRIFNITNKSNPFQVGIYTDYFSLESPSYIYVDDDFAYFTSNYYDSLNIFNISNKSNPIKISSISNSSSMDYAWDVSAEQDYVYVTAKSSNSFTIIETTSYPINLYLEIGTPDGSYEWNFSGNFNESVSPKQTSDLSSSINSALNGGLCDCRNCTQNGDYCLIPFLFHSDNSGILNYNNINITYQINNRYFWDNIGNHSQFSSLNWNISNITEQSEVDLRCRSIDLNGSRNYSDYYNPGINLTISKLITSVNNCRKLDYPNTIYNQTSNIIPSGIPIGGTCINITVSNITFDCNGFWISSTSNLISGIYASKITNVTIKNCNISLSNSGYGIIFDLVNDSLIIDNILNSNNYGFYLKTNSKNNLIKDSNLYYNTLYDVYIINDSINNTFINCSFNTEYVSSGSELIRKWYLNSQVNYSNGTASYQTNISGWNVFSSLQFSELTDTNGKITTKELIEYINNGTKKFYSNYSINATKEGYHTSSQSVNLTTNKDLFFNLTIFPFYSLCYQEQTNGSTAGDSNCSLNYSGSYSYNGNWSSPNNAYDRNWTVGTANSTTPGSTIFFNYYKPDNSFYLALNTSLWKVKDSTGTVNLYLDQNCFNRNPINLSVGITPACFSKNMKVLMARTGLPKNIQDIVVGDVIMAYDENSSSLIPSTVIQTFYHNVSEDPDGYYIINNLINVTGIHPLYSNHQWVVVKDLKVGDNLTYINRSDVPITSIDHINTSIETYNLEVNNTHNYFVSNYLVHNKGFGNITWQCWNGTGNIVLRNFAIGVGTGVYEEAMIWNVTQ